MHKTTSKLGISNNNNNRNNYNNERGRDNSGYKSIDNYLIDDQEYISGNFKCLERFN
jgi:hypothetical protein